MYNEKYFRWSHGFHREGNRKAVPALQAIPTKSLMMRHGGRFPK